MATKKTPVKKVSSKKDVKTIVKKPAAKTPAKKAAAKAPAKKVVAKAPAKKVVAKAPAKKVVAKAPAKKVVAKAPSKSVTKKVTPTKNTVVKTVAKKDAHAKKGTVKPTAKKVVAKTPAKKVVAKPVVKKAVAKPIEKNVTPAKKGATPKTAKVIVQKESAKPKEVKVEVKKEKKAPVKNKATKTVFAPTNPMAKPSDVFKTNTFASSNLRNETGKIIAHRKTEDMKRKPEAIQVKKYEPDQKRSLLDNTMEDTGPTFRYSDEDLQEFKELILAKLEKAKTELQYLQAVIMRKDEGGTEDTENKYQSIEDGSAAMEREQFTQMAGRQLNFINHLEQALVRVENKTYGICRETGKLIDKARLKAVPHATLSIEAKNARKN